MITVTESAKQKMLSILAEENAEFIRFGLRGGGCNGFTYFFQIETNPPEADDTVIAIDDKSLLVDSMSLMYVNEAKIDYKKDLMGESFVFDNPQQTSHCGCGNSVGF